MRLGRVGEVDKDLLAWPPPPALACPRLRYTNQRQSGQDEIKRWTRQDSGRTFWNRTDPESRARIHDR